MLTGCIAPPEISIKAVDVVERGENTVELALRIELHNVSDEPVKLDMWDYQVDAGGGRYSGHWSAGLTVPPQDSITTSIPAVVKKDSDLGASARWSVNGSVTYLAPSRLAEVLFELGLNRPSTGFSGSGTGTGEGGKAPSAG